MPKRPKRPRDLNQWAKHMVDLATGAAIEPVPMPASAAVERGGKGGQRGGKARAKVLTKAERVAIAKKAAKARWKPGTD
jgi:hypothetical protein